MIPLVQRWYIYSRSLLPPHFHRIQLNHPRLIPSPRSAISIPLRRRS